MSSISIAHVWHYVVLGVNVCTVIQQQPHAAFVAFVAADVQQGCFVSLLQFVAREGWIVMGRFDVNRTT